MRTPAAGVGETPVFVTLGGAASNAVTVRLGNWAHPMKIRLRLLFVLAAAAGVAEGQNSDLGLLLGASVTSTSVSGRSASTDVAGGFQINYAFQLLETVAGRLYVEVPFILTGAVRTSAAFGQVSTSVDSIFLYAGGAVEVHAVVAAVGVCGGRRRTGFVRWRIRV